MPRFARFRRHLLTANTFVAVLAVALATIVQISLGDAYGPVVTWVTYCFAVFIAALYGGMRPALLALTLGYFANTLLFVSPGTLGIAGENTKDMLTGFSVYLAFGLFAAFITESLHRARRRAEQAAHEAREQSARLQQREEALRQSRNRLRTTLEAQSQIEAALRQSEQRFRIALTSGTVTVFEQDRDLRYAWVYPQDPDFPEGNLGSTDVELLPDPDGAELMRLKAEVMRTGRGVRKTMRATLPAGVRYYDLVVEPRRDDQGRIHGVCGAALDVTAQKLVEEALKEADRHKNEFLATLAHELRNPLAAIGYANEITRQAAAADREFVDIIDHQVRHLTRLIDEMLDVARITQGKIQLEEEHLDMATVLNRAVATVRPLIEAHRHELSLEMPHAAMPVWGDAMRLEQIVVNLLSNAAKYTPKGGKIRLSAAPQAGAVVLCIRDNGSGIDPKMLPRVFDLFAQGSRARGRSEGGLGIGLTLVRRLVEMHGGTVTAASEGVGRGSQFTVRLPLALPPRMERKPHAVSMTV